jgi:hypothetical protein
MTKAPASRQIRDIDDADMLRDAAASARAPGAYIMLTSRLKPAPTTRVEFRHSECVGSWSFRPYS